jgi:hypothetical protein
MELEFKREFTYFGQLVRKVMDVNEHQKLLSNTLKTLIEVNEQDYYCCSTFHSHSRVFNNESNSYVKMSAKLTLASS